MIRELCKQALGPRGHVLCEQGARTARGGQAVKPLYEITTEISKSGVDDTDLHLAKSFASIVAVGIEQAKFNQASDSAVGMAIKAENKR